MPKLPCGCPNEIACFHGPCQVIRGLTGISKLLIENKQGNVRLANPGELTTLPDGRVQITSVQDAGST